MLRSTKFRKLTAASVASVCALIGVQGIAPTPASAMLSFPFDGQIAPPSGSFGRTEPTGPALANPGSVAIDDFNHETYVAEENENQVNPQGKNAVAVFAADGSELSPLDGEATPAGTFGNRSITVAANNGTGSVYVLDSADNVLDVFDSSGNYLCQITGAGSSSTSSSECDPSTNPAENPPTSAGDFDKPRGVAVNQKTGEIYVLDGQNGVIDIFSSVGTFERSIALNQVPAGAPYLMNDLAVSAFNGHVYVSEELRGIQEFDVTGGYVSEWTGEGIPGGQFNAGIETVAADDHNGDVYVTRLSGGQQSTYAFSVAGAYLTQFSHSYHDPESTTVDEATGKVYVSDAAGSVGGELAIPRVVDTFGPGVIVPDVVTEPATDVEAHSALLEGAVGPDETQLVDCHFEYGTSESYDHSVPCVPAAAAIPNDGIEHQVSATIQGLKAGTVYHFRLVAANAAGEDQGDDQSLSTLPGPVLGVQAARNLTGETAELTAEINPEGAETTYRFEYDTRPYAEGEAAHGEVPLGGEGVLPATGSPDQVGVELSRLDAASTYFWRVVAANAREVTTGLGHSFVYSSGGVGLPDGRAYEMVTPAQKNAALLGAGLLIVPADVSGDGTRVMAASIQCFSGARSCTASRENEGEPYLFTRTSSGWQTTALAPPPLETNGNSVWLMNADTGAALFSMPTPSTGDEVFYAGHADGSLTDVGSATTEGLAFATGLLLATPDLSHIAFELHGGSSWPFDTTVAGQWSSFELAGANNPAPSLVGVSGGPGSTALISTCSTALGSPGAHHSLSLDGSMLYFTAVGHSEYNCPASAQAPVSNELYARIGGSRTVAISRRAPLDCTTGPCRNSLPGDAYFEDASADGRQVFFTDTQQLTDNASQDSDVADTAANRGCVATTGPNGCNLYEYDFNDSSGHNLIAASAGDTSGLGPQVQRVMASADDGSHVYFVARGVLSRADNDQGAHAIAGGENLYLFERDAAYPDGRVAFIATLSKLDSSEYADSDEPPMFPPNTTPNGRFLVFTSRANLTADDDSTSNAAQVFRYDAQSGQLVRVSVGEQGFNDNGNTFAQLCEGVTCAQDATIAGVTSAGRRDPTMSDDGAYVFFSSPVGLTAHALNDVQITTTEHGLPVYAENVYEYHDGHVYLISDGKDASRIGPTSSVQLLGSDRTGANVFFSTVDQLVPQDTDTQRDYYDARICTVASPCVPATAAPLPPCLGEACHGTPSPAPARLAPASAAFSGDSNIGPALPIKQRSATRTRLARALAVCRHLGTRRRRAVCEARARERYGAGHRQTRSKSRKGGK